MLHLFGVHEYHTDNGRKPFSEWLRGLKDYRAETIIRNRIKRIRLGHFGDCGFVGNGVWELRIFGGPGYRIYYLIDNRCLVILLCGGDKDSQTRDIGQAHLYAKDYWRRK